MTNLYGVPRPKDHPSPERGTIHLVQIDESYNIHDIRKAIEGHRLSTRFRIHGLNEFPEIHAPDELAVVTRAGIRRKITTDIGSTTIRARLLLLSELEAANLRENITFHNRELLDEFQLRSYVKHYHQLAVTTLENAPSLAEYWIPKGTLVVDDAQLALHADSYFHDVFDRVYQHESAQENFRTRTSRQLAGLRKRLRFLGIPGTNRVLAGGSLDNQPAFQAIQIETLFSLYHRCGRRFMEEILLLAQEQEALFDERQTVYAIGSQSREKFYAESGFTDRGPLEELYGNERFLGGLKGYRTPSSRNGKRVYAYESSLGLLSEPTRSRSGTPSMSRLTGASA